MGDTRVYIGIGARGGAIFQSAPLNALLLSDRLVIWRLVNVVTENVLLCICVRSLSLVQPDAIP